MLFSSSRYPYLSVKIESAVEILAPTGKNVVKQRPRVIQFSKGSYITQNKAIIDGLLNHPSYNSDYFGPFSTEDVRSGVYLEKLNEHIEKNIADGKVFDVKKIAAQGLANSKGPQVISHTINPSNPPSEPVILKAKDILEREAIKIKKDLEATNG